MQRQAGKEQFYRPAGTLMSEGSYAACRHFSTPV
jgi:hypothetical protein